MKRNISIVLIVLLFGGVYVTMAQNITWIELSSLFGLAKPFRQGHSAAMTTFGRMVSFSGLDNTLTGSPRVTRFNYLTTSQLQILQDNPATDRLSRQLCGFGTYNNSRLVVHGGLVGGIASKELIVFDIPGGVWLPVNTSLDDPDHNDANHFTFASEAPAAAIDQQGGYLWLFGGKSTILNLNAITRVDLNTYRFYQVNSSNEPPSRRHGCAMAFYNDGFLLFGGRDALDENEPHEYFNDLYRFESGAFLAPTNTGPSARAFVASALRKDGVTWVIFGGQDMTTPFNDVWALNLGTRAWSQINPNGTPPTIRSKAVGVSLQWNDEDSILFYGGADNQGGSLNSFWKLQLVTASGGPITPPPDLDQDADVTDELTGTTAPPPPVSSSVASSSVGPILPEDAAASVLVSWCSWL
jgi:hypothetical protein